MEQTTRVLTEFYIKRPLTLLNAGKQKLSRTKLAILGFISTFASVDKDGLSVACRASYAQMARDFNVSVRTVSAAISSLKKENLIKRQDKSGKVAEYTTEYRPDIDEKFYIITCNFLYTMEFNFYNGVFRRKRFLKKSEIDVISLMISHALNPKTEGVFRGSVRTIARHLKLSPKTVHEALTELERAKLFNRGKKAVNRHHDGYSVFYVSSKLIARVKRVYDWDKKAAEREKVKQAKAAQKEEVRQADMRSERDKYYSDLRYEYSKKQERVDKYIQNTPEYKAVDKKFVKVNPREAAQAEIDNDRPKLEEFQRREAERAAEIAKVYATYLAPEDIPKYRCDKCSDTGYKPDGRACDCYPRF